MDVRLYGEIVQGVPAGEASESDTLVHSKGELPQGSSDAPGLLRRAIGIQFPGLKGEIARGPGQAQQKLPSTRGGATVNRLRIRCLSIKGEIFQGPNKLMDAEAATWYVASQCR